MNGLRIQKLTLNTRENEGPIMVFFFGGGEGYPDKTSKKGNRT